MRESKTIELILKAIETKNSSFMDKLETLNESMRVEIDEEKEGAKSWIDHESLRNSRIEPMSSQESVYFEKLIEKYLDPNGGDGGASEPQVTTTTTSTTTTSMSKKAKVIEGLRDLRNNCAYCYLILNGFWLLIMFTLNLLKPKMVDKIYLDLRFNTSSAPRDSDKFEPVSFCYVILFATVLVIQFGAMVWHRVITFTQVIRKTSLLDSHKPRAASRPSTTGVVCRREQNGHVNNQFKEGVDEDRGQKESVVVDVI